MKSFTNYIFVAALLGACHAGAGVGPVHAGGGVDPPAVRYEVSSIRPEVHFYTHELGFKVDHQDRNFAQLSKGKLVLLLSAPGEEGAKKMNGKTEHPGGWNRIVLDVDNLRSTMGRLDADGIKMKDGIHEGHGDLVATVTDPEGNLVELRQEHGAKHDQTTRR